MTIIDKIKAHPAFAGMLGFFVALLIASAVLLVWGVTHYSEPGFMPGWPQYKPNQTPLRVCSAADGDLEGPIRASDEDEQHTVAAISAINEGMDFVLMQRHFSVMDNPEDDCDVVVVYHWPREVPQRHAASKINEALGETYISREDPLTCVVHVYGDANGGDLAKLVVEHELGHCLGLAHDPDNHVSIMQPSLSETPDGQFPPRISDSDRDLLRSLYGPTH